MEGRAVSFSSQKKRGFFWVLGIVTTATLFSLAWHQINAVLEHRFFSF